MKRLFVCIISSLGQLQNSIQVENINSKAKVIVCDYTKDDLMLENLIKEKLNFASIVSVNRICLRNGVEIQNLNELKDDEFVYVITSDDDKQKSEQIIVPSFKDEWITLNVGGRIFTTTRTTLTREPDSFFGRMFSLEFQDWTPRTQNGAITIDRSSRYFEVILDYLRHGKLVCDQNENLSGILEEARFFSLENLIILIENEIVIREQNKIKEEKALIDKIAEALSAINNDLTNDKFTLNRRHVMQSLMQTKSEAYLRFQSINLKGADLSRLDLSWINFKYANLSGANFSSSNLSFSCFERADLSQANLENAKLHGVRMACCNLENCILSGADFEDPTGKISNLEGANLKNANARMVNMNNINLRVANLKNADFTGSSLKYAKLAGADLEMTIFNGCDLTEANLRGANFTNTSLNFVQNALHMSQVGP